MIYPPGYFNGLAQQAANLPSPPLGNNMLNQLGNAIQGHAGSLMGGLGQSYGVLQGAMGAANAQAAMNTVWPPPAQFEENVPEDELRFEGILSRWGALGSQQWPLKRTHHAIDCCQRMLML